VSVRIAIVIPTRNRPELAVKAVKSLLGQKTGLDIIVSDNSSSAGKVRDFCQSRKGVHFLRPPSELPMPEHWDWAVRQAMALSPATHFSVHYDRKISRPGAWARVASAVAQRPDLLMTLAQDFVSHVPPPLRLWQTPWTGKTWSIRTAGVASLLANGRVVLIAHTLPILSNCVVPRDVLDRIVTRFGDLCSSTGPDSAFMARFLALNESYVHFDRAIGILHGSERSNGLGYLRGTGGDFADYQKSWGDRPWLAAAPIPGINLGSNMLFHEYELVRRATGDRLPPIDPAAALDDLSQDLKWVADPDRKAELRRILQDHGWNGAEPEPQPEPPPGWYEYQRKVLLRARWLGRVPDTITGFSFRDDAEALRHGLKYPRRAQSQPDHLAPVEPVEIGAA
jgi:hypothetical protein